MEKTRETLIKMPFLEQHLNYFRAINLTKDLSLPNSERPTTEVLHYFSAAQLMREVLVTMAVYTVSDPLVQVKSETMLWRKLKDSNTASLHALRFKTMLWLSRFKMAKSHPRSYSRQKRRRSKSS